ncbi:hypothetical protein R3P38DRAFT_2502440 [Favolaschia claudopus]|uniref:Uncharacterized protein n=1 Tax=Favolaschia claudopus TaxID=2862362 RepID=A0AAW0DLL6_9AGAR
MRSTSEIITHFRETVGDVPPGLTGASTTVAGSRLYLFGGSLAGGSDRKLSSDLYALDLDLWKWEKIIPAMGEHAPPARYSHTLDFWRNHLVLYGGLGEQSSSKRTEVLNDVRLFNLTTRRWLRPSRIFHASTVPKARHLHLSCISVDKLFVLGGKDSSGDELEEVCVYDLVKKEWIQIQPQLPKLKATCALVATSQWYVRTPPQDIDHPDTPMPLRYSERATSKSPCDMYLYQGNSGQTLDVFSSSSNGKIAKKSTHHTAQLPSFHSPCGAVLGNSLILAGNHPIDGMNQTFSIWTFDTNTTKSVCIDTGDVFQHGSWTHGFLWEVHNKFVVFGKRGEPLGDPSGETVLNWDAVVVVDLEALGIYQPPVLKLSTAAQKLGLKSLAGSHHTDFDFICDDGRRIPCSRKTIFDRWPWLLDQHTRLSSTEASVKHQKRTELTITKTTLTSSQSYPVTMALLQYFYSLTLGTALQRAPAVLSHLLLISTEYYIPHLRALVTHAMHLALTELTADGIFEIAAACGCRSLQIRYVFFTWHPHLQHGSRLVSGRSGYTGREK